MMISLKRRYTKNTNFRKRIAFIYLFLIFICSILLSLPFFQNESQNISFTDIFFISASTFSDTGLTPVNINDTFSFSGKIVLLILMQIGAIGIMSIKVLIFILIDKKLNIEDRMMIKVEHGQSQVAGLVKLIKGALSIMFTVQIFFIFIVTIHFILVYNYSIFEALWFAWFHCTSAITNSGLELTSNSLIDYSKDYLFLTYTMILIVIGGLGFPVLNDLKYYFKSKKENKKFKFSLFSKLSFMTYFYISIIAVVLVSISDYELLYVENNIVDGLFYSIFQVISTRSAGFSTISITEFSNSSILLFSVLMFIGAAPASTGGGIRTTTFALLFIYIITYMNNKKDVEVYNRRIPIETILKAFSTLVIALIIVSISIFIIVNIDSNLNLTAIVFEVCSAFGTTGLSLNITSHLSDISKLLLVIVMIIGQIGILNTLFIIGKNKDKSNKIRLPEEDVTIG